MSRNLNSKGCPDYDQLTTWLDYRRWRPEKPRCGSFRPDLSPRRFVFGVDNCARWTTQLDNPPAKERCSLPAFPPKKDAEELRGRELRGRELRFAARERERERAALRCASLGESSASLRERERESCASLRGRERGRAALRCARVGESCERERVGESCERESWRELREREWERAAFRCARVGESCAAPRSLYFALMFAGDALERAQKSRPAHQVNGSSVLDGSCTLTGRSPSQLQQCQSPDTSDHNRDCDFFSRAMSWSTCSPTTRSSLWASEALQPLYASKQRWR